MEQSLRWRCSGHVASVVVGGAAEGYGVLIGLGLLARFVAYVITGVALDDVGIGSAGGTGVGAGQVVDGTAEECSVTWPRPAGLSVMFGT